MSRTARADGMVLFVDDEDHLRRAAAQSFDLADMAFADAATGADALARLTPEFNGVVISDIRMPGMSGTDLLAAVRAIDPDLPVILITGHGDVDLAVQSMRDGAFDFIEKPFDPARLVDRARRAIETRALVLENRMLRQRLIEGRPIEARITGRGEATEALRRSIARIAATDADVLVSGATGTGKGVVARALHDGSARAAAPFVQINCAALPEGLIESELFGHEAGAFPGALRARFGKFEHARGGTLCLDEVDSLPLGLQAKLLHVIEAREVTRLGSNDPVPLDIRVVAITKAEPEQAVSGGRFRADLFYRLAVAHLRVPTLAARSDDIPTLFLDLVAEVAARHDMAVPEVPGAVLSDLAADAWPGNIRELKNAAERFVLALGSDGDAVVAATDPGSLADRVAAFEKAQIAAALAAHGGRLKETYGALGLSRKTLYEKMQKHGLSRDDDG